jgi:hypothetical protein
MQVSEWRSPDFQMKEMNSGAGHLAKKNGNPGNGGIPPGQRPIK